MSPSLDPLTRIFTATKTVDNKLLNRLGLQSLRSVAARSIHQLLPSRTDAAVQEIAAELDHEGLVTLPNFLPADLFEKVREECTHLIQHNPDRIEIVQAGPNKVDIAKLSSFQPDEVPYALQFFCDPTLNALMRAAEKRPQCDQYAVRTIERLQQGPLDGEEDPETVLHSDCFFNTHKVWLYLSNVRMESGPLVFVKRSHRMTLRQIYFLYQESCQINRGSRRITQDEIQRAGFEETIVTCPKNTLVIANTLGYHRRLRGQPGHERYALHVQLRTNPFTWWRYRASGESGH